MNFFQQKHEPKIDGFIDLRTNLQNKEPSVYRFVLNGMYGEESLDHAFAILKYTKDGSVKYQVLQSYVNVYNLQGFLKNHGNEYHFDDFDSLNEKFLKPLENYVTRSYPDWTQEIDDEFKKITTLSLLSDNSLSMGSMVKPISLIMRRSTHEFGALSKKEKLSYCLPSLETLFLVLSIETISLIASLRGLTFPSAFRRA